ncbi:hypothetical protein Rs2_38578 [Raphanus sativus]|nr:hypothetical protein Rs2_38578 [Raphanus sativus]
MSPKESRYYKSQWVHMVENMITAFCVEKPRYLRLQRNGGSEHVISCQWDPGGAGSDQEDKIKRVGSDEGTLLFGHYQETRLIRSTIEDIKATDHGKKGRGIGVLFFENLMKVSFESWIRGRLIPIMNSLDTVKGTSRDDSGRDHLRNTSPGSSHATGCIHQDHLSCYCAQYISFPFRTVEVWLCGSQWETQWWRKMKERFHNMKA